MPPLTQATLEKPFACVVVEAKPLAQMRANATPFADQFSSASADPSVLSFPNLGGDAQLIVPRCLTEPAHYAHLATFLRQAPTHQQQAFWHAAGPAMLKHLSGAPLWISTAGLGVSWLHLRLDSRPKYYRHQPYKMY